MKKSRRPKKKEEQPKSKTKKNKKKVGQAKKPQDECSGSNPSVSDGDDGKNQMLINVPPPPRFSETVLAAKASMLRGAAPSSCYHPTPPQVSPGLIEFVDESPYGGLDDTTLAQAAVTSVLGTTDNAWCSASSLNTLGVNPSEVTQIDWQVQGSPS